MASTDPRRTGIVLPNWLGVMTHAQLTAAYPAASWSGFTARASDAGLAPGIVLVSDGVRWVPNGPQVLGRSAAAVSCPADTSEDTLATVTVPANLMGVDGSLRVWTLWTVTSSTN